MLAAAVTTWFIAPSQEARSDRAVQADQTARAQAGDPLRVNAYYAFVPEDGVVFVTPNPLRPQEKAQVTNPASTRESTRKLLSPHGGLQLAYPPGAPASNVRMLTRLKVLLEGRREGSLLIKDIRARVMKRTPPLAGAFVNGPPQGEGDAVQIGFDLDSTDLSARKSSWEGRLQGRYIDSKFITLQRGEQIPLNVIASSAKSYCEWVIDITVWANGREEKMTIDDGGRPFRSTALARRYTQEFYFQLMKYPNRFEEVPPKTRGGR